MANKGQSPYRAGPRSLVDGITLMYLFWAVMAYLVTVAGLWWSSNYLIEMNLVKRASHWAAEFDELGTPLYFSNDAPALERVRARAAQAPDILYVRYYNAGDLKLLGQYAKETGKPPAAELPTEALAAVRQGGEPLVLTSHLFYTVNGIRVLAPIQTHSLGPEGLLDMGDGPETARTIGYLDIGVDLEPSRKLLLRNMLLVSLLLAAVLLAAAAVGRHLARAALRPLLDLQGPLSRLAKGDLDVSVEGSPGYREIATIHDAVRASIDGLRQRDQDKEQALREKLHAELASEAKSRFLAHLSHEVRTPLNGIMGFLGLLRKTPLDDVQRDYLQAVETSSHRLLMLINDVLDISKIEAGKLSLECTAFNLRELAEECVAMHAPAAHAKGLELTLEADRGIPMELAGDPGRLSQVLCNLVGNAIKFTEAGEVAVEVRLIGETDGDALIQVSVADTGIGIADGAVGSLFQPFTQADDSTTRKYGGTGLGLAISSRLLEMMGAGLKVDSAPGKGSTFHFMVRLRKPAQPSLPRPVAALEGLGALIVSPNPRTVSSLGEQLLGWGMEDGAAAGGEAALAALRRAAGSGYPFRFVILDGAVADTAPVEFAARVRAEPELAPLDLVLLVNTGERLAAGSAEYVHYTAVLAKPAKSAELHRVLVRALGVPDIGAQVPAADGAADSPGLARSLRILVADDDDINRKLVTILLEQAGAAVDQVLSGREAVEACRNQGYDLVFMDVQMPEMDGVAATREIRHIQEGGFKTPIVALTANALRGDRERYLEAGMDGYLAKPIDQRALFETVARWYPLRRAGLPTMAAPCAPCCEDARPLPVIDPRLGIARAAGRADRWLKFLEMLAKDLPASLERMENALAEGRVDEVAAVAHKLRGGSSYCGTPVFQRAADHLEAACLRETPQTLEIRARLDILKHAAGELLSLLASGDFPKE
jgi:signal transduction histidine kinase/CheY-like chemotaxis protein/HPt (histidine-containing phosphotransfer) domain-containing protein